MNRTCLACGVSIAHRFQQATSCSTACYQWARKRPGVPRPTRQCLACGASLAGRHPNTRACSRSCSHWANRHPGVPKPTGRTCLGCGDCIDQLLSAATTCSNVCMRWHQNHPGGELRNPPTHCRVCGEAIVGRRADTDVCSIRCRDRRPERRERNRDKEARRRARKMRVFIGPIDSAAVFERDAWMCHICGAAIDRSLAWPHVMSKSIDHVIPLARGGPHAMSNLRAAHLACNSRKGARVDAMAGAERAR